MSVTGGAPCPGMNRETGQPPWRAVSSSEEGEGDEWAAYVALDTYNEDVPRDHLQGALRREALCHILGSAGRNSEESFLNLMAYSDLKGQPGTIACH